jgi:hypothetical protein
VPAIDDHLPGHGFASGAFHEITGGTELADDAAATISLARIDGPVFWCLRWRDLFAPALDLAGLHPDRVTMSKRAATPMSCSPPKAQASPPSSSAAPPPPMPRLKEPPP